MKKKRLYIVSACLTILSILSLIPSIILTENNTKYWWTILVSSIIFIALLVLTCVLYFPNAEFICTKCDKQFKPKVGASLMAVHTITRRYLKCPHCNQKSWAKETWNFQTKKDQ